MQSSGYQSGTRSASDEWTIFRSKLEEKNYPLWPGTSDGEYVTFCPLHESEGPHDPSMSISVTPEQKVLTYCHVCEDGCFAEVMKGEVPECTATEAWKVGSNGHGGRGDADGRSPRPLKRRKISKIELVSERPDIAHLVAEWSWQISAEEDGFPSEVAQHYYDAGKYCKVRWSDKSFAWYTKMGGIWRSGLRDGVPGLYGADKLKPGEGLVIAAEGEKDVEALRELGFEAVSTHLPRGKKARNIAEAMQGIPVEWARGKTIVVVPDNDDAGMKTAEKFANAVKDAGLARGIKLLQPLGKDRGYDASDWIADGGTKDALITIATDAPWIPGGEPGSMTPPPDRGRSEDSWEGTPRPGLNVSSQARVAEWIREHLGKEGEPLAGVFLRNGELVFTPRENEEGYVALTDRDGDHDSPAQIRVLTAGGLKARIQYRYWCFKEKIDESTGEVARVHVIFPDAPAKLAVDAPNDMKGVRKLNGVVHAPVVRADGTVMEKAGYDPATKLLYLPEPGTEHAVRVSAQPSAEEVEHAKSMIFTMIAEFPWVSENDKANYIGMLLTPMLRQVAPPPYKLCVIAAHQPGSGKTLLARLLEIIHGGVFRAEMPGDDSELGKQITSILTFTTGMVAIFDNVSGVLKSPKLAGLLTSARWDDRPLGRTEWVHCINDRLWVATGNNVRIGGDIARRTIQSAIDPGMPNPETRTGFAITDLESWAREHRGELLRSLLTLVRHWVASGRPLSEEASSDSYALWTQTVNGVLGACGIEGEFDHIDTRLENGGEREWAGFLEAVWEAWGSGSWTARELLEACSLTGTGALQLEGKKLNGDILPGDIAEKAARNISGAAKSLGHWLSNHDGRWAEKCRVVRAPGGEKPARWAIEKSARRGPRERSYEPPR